ncbi:hypothetical protein COK01_29575 [Priestia megaterium]|uniref:Uncharacterized protein n=1 Tax=Priestia megaterium TaxID=1404 RepID=A0AAE5P2X3_PRIMG|nr:hypothetical protein AMS61_28645 [Bacillus sp. FJAT-21351]KQU17477.1 hypothetical protein ASG61_28585 [Bacillus sp. Leaf75]PEE45043.1 hypothetical protein COM71_23025 [Priestia megaterium]RFB19371.1 hypothetical protein DZB87_29285 [Bacillus sp. ALD]RFB32151.1 hypothetical protein DZB86_31015 [Bacillus sp. RC]
MRKKMTPIMVPISNEIVWERVKKKTYVISKKNKLLKFSIRFYCFTSTILLTLNIEKYRICLLHYCISIRHHFINFKFKKKEAELIIFIKDLIRQQSKNAG